MIHNDVNLEGTDPRIYNQDSILTHEIQNQIW